VYRGFFQNSYHEFADFVLFEIVCAAWERFGSQFLVLSKTSFQLVAVEATKILGVLDTERRSYLAEAKEEFLWIGH
jgi:hypothetical protein